MFKLIIIIVTLLGTVVINAQSTKTSSATTSTTKTDGKLVAHNSVSVNSSDKAYSLRAEFNANDYSRIKSILEDNLDNAYKAKSGTTLNWTKEENNKIAYAFILTNSKLRINIYRDLVSNNTFEKLKALSNKLSTIISNKK
jgi:hypothetical protein